MDIVLNNKTIAEWHRGMVNRLLQRFRSGHMPHAILLSGKPGIGKRQTANYIAQTILCQETVTSTDMDTFDACGQCHSCTLFAAQTHPDFICIAPQVF